MDPMVTDPAATRSRGRRMPLLFLFVTVLLGLGVGWVGLNRLDGATAPAPSALPPVPHGATLLERGMECGSGGCWQQMRVRAGAQESGAQLAARMEVSDTERCDGWSWRTLQRVCIGAYIGAHQVTVYARHR